MDVAVITGEEMMEIIELGKTPISEAAPAGADIRMEADFDALSAEIEKLSSVSASGSADWRKIVLMSQDILTGRSKDLLVVSYLSVALMKTEGLEGLAVGVHVLRDLLDGFWETMFPSKARMRGRKNAVEWWSDRLKSGIGELAPQRWPQEKRDALIEDLKVIDDFFGQHLEDAPILSPMIKNINALVEIDEDVPAAPQAAPSRDAAPPSETVVASKVSTAAGAQGIVRSPEAGASPAAGMDTEKLLLQALDALGRYAGAIAQQDPRGALPYRLRRLCAWLPVMEPPPAQEGKTLIPPPDGQIVSVMQQLYHAGNWQGLLEDAESRIPTFLFWIDLHAYVAESLDQLGHPEASEAVAMETLIYIKRLPGVERLAFADGTPFANDQTREWLKGLMRPAGAPPEKVPLDSSGLEQLVAQETQTCQDLVKSGKLSEAIGSFRDKMKQASGLRERFIWEIGFCRLLIAIKQARLAVPYLHELIEYLDQYKVEKWEPVLATEALATVLSGLRMQAEQQDEALIQAVLNRVVALNPVAALDFI